MAHASSTVGHTSEPRHCYLKDPMGLNFLNISATEDFSFPPNSSASSDEGITGSCTSSFQSNFVSG
jgi:hypothetical protein